MKGHIMPCNSFVFILLLLPMTILAYFVANKISLRLGKIIIIGASVIFYSYSDWKAFNVLGISLIMNYTFIYLMGRFRRKRKVFMAVPIIINIGLLVYFKYFNFLILIVNEIFDNDYALMEIIQPLGISFFTFQQIAYVVAICNKEIENKSLVDYLIYILYFPKVLMGPLMDPVEFSRQIDDKALKIIDCDNIACGIKIFSLGLFKKVMIADVFAKGTAWGWANADKATAVDWMLITLFYTFEIYFDFSGYSDMAVGASQMLNITLPINFDSPYKALSIRDFWKRWHISLTRFFTKYVYIPLGGDRKGKLRTYANTMLVFLVSGLWHGANWTFILWGILHGALMVFDRIFEKSEKKIFEPVRWFITFATVNVLWLLFRSESITQWKYIVKAMLMMQNTTISSELIDCFFLQETNFVMNTFHFAWTTKIRGFWMFAYVILALGICLVPENNYKNLNKLSIRTMILAAIMFVWGFICLSSESIFVYFNF